MYLQCCAPYDNTTENRAVAHSWAFAFAYRISRCQGDRKWFVLHVKWLGILQNIELEQQWSGCEESSALSATWAEGYSSSSAALFKPGSVLHRHDNQKNREILHTAENHIGQCSSWSKGATKKYIICKMSFAPLYDGALIEQLSAHKFPRSALGADYVIFAWTACSADPKWQKMNDWAEIYLTVHILSPLYFMFYSSQFHYCWYSWPSVKKKERSVVST